MARGYAPELIEPKWQRVWETSSPFSGSPRGRLDRPTYYCLVMFPYPSGRIHMGHVRNYVIGDVIARYKRMRGYDVLHPIGWDAFGLPAENAAIDHGTHPRQWTAEHIASMKVQLRRLALSYDWDREVMTCDPAYYHWNQWFFLRMYERGLAYRKRAYVNWCPDCETVLANEQVVDGRCWRCEAEVTQRELEQWFFRITAYAEELLRDCDRLTGWPAQVIAMQRHWIGKSEGAEMNFPLVEGGGALRVFTTRLDTIYGATFLLLAPAHPRIETVIQGRPEAQTVRAFCEQWRRTAGSPQALKAGVFTGAYARNPYSEEQIPIWVAAFVLMDYGTGAVMGVPAHDQRDFEFAQCYGLPIQVVVRPSSGSHPPQAEDETEGQAPPLSSAYVEDGVLVASGPFSGLSGAEARDRMVALAEQKAFGRRAVTYRLRDWGISRQRYWGTPIPILYCETCGIVPVSDSALPVVLPQDVPFTGKGGSPLREHGDFLSVPCPRCRQPARRETDTMDTFVDSSWYFLRYLSPRHTGAPFDTTTAASWMPVDQYIGGIEHAVLHLLYARFFVKMIRDLGLVTCDEPFTHLLTQGMVVKESVRCELHGYLYPDEVEGGARCRTCGRTVVVGRIEKMSKSKKNIVDPDTLISTYGADAVRLFILFAAPPEKDLEWSAQGVEGMARFLQRAWRIVDGQAYHVAQARQRFRTTPWPAALPEPVRALRRATHLTITKATRDIEGGFQFNTVIASFMELSHTISRFLGEHHAGPAASSASGGGSGGGEPEGHELRAVAEAIETLVHLLAPFAPHLAEELWERLGHRPGVGKVPWPESDPVALAVTETLIVVQVNGKVRTRLTVPMDQTAKESVLALALEDERVRAHMAGKRLRNAIYVPTRLLNLVVGE